MQMLKVKCLALFCFAVLIASCGPDTIFVRPALDTPSQHVDNGRQLLRSGKVDDACREFKRAQELDPDFIDAYIGLGIALGHKGDFTGGYASMDQAMQMAKTPQQKSQVREGYKQLDKLKQ